MSTCAHCGHTKREPRTMATMPIDLATCSSEALYAHYKASAPAGDLRFLHLHASHLPEVAEAALALFAEAFTEAGELRIARPVFYRRYVSLQDMWRGADNAWHVAHAGDDRRVAVRARVEAAILCSQVARERSRFLRWALHIDNVPSADVWLAECAAKVATCAGDAEAAWLAECKAELSRLSLDPMPLPARPEAAKPRRVRKVVAPVAQPEYVPF